MTGKFVMPSTTSVVERTYYSILSRTVAAATQDRARMRSMIYDLARMTMIRRNLYHAGSEEIDWSGMQHEYRALEAAIRQVEARYADDTDQLFSLEILDPEPPIHYSLSRPSRPHAFYPIALRWSFWRTVLLAAAVGVAIYIATGGVDVLSDLRNFYRSRETQQRVPSKENTAPAPQPALQPSIPAIPLPTTYGIYALSSGHLTELDSLPIRVPDPRIAISASISTPSRAHLSNGQLEFIVFKRNLINNAPDKASLRVVARVARALIFDAKGKAKFADVDATWVVRGNSYPLKVAPIANNPEMIVIRPENADFVFPAGRYALVLQNSAYDFTVDGSDRNAAHCLERTDGLNAPLYTECRNP